MNSRNETRPGDPVRTTTHAPEKKEPDLTIERADVSQVEQAAIRPQRILPDLSVSLAAMRNIRIFDPAEALIRLRELHGNQYFESIGLETLAAHGHTQKATRYQLTVIKQVKSIREYADDDLIIPRHYEIKPDPNLKDDDILRCRRLHVLLEDAQDGTRPLRKSRNAHPLVHSDIRCNRHSRRA